MVDTKTSSTEWIEKLKQKLVTESAGANDLSATVALASLLLDARMAQTVEQLIEIDITLSEILQTLVTLSEQGREILQTLSERERG